MKLLSGLLGFRLDGAAGLRRVRLLADLSDQLLADLAQSRRQLRRRGAEQEIVDAALVLDRADAVGRAGDCDAALQAGAEESGFLQVGQETTLGLVIGVGNLMADQRLFPGNFTLSGHD